MEGLDGDEECKKEGQEKNDDELHRHHEDMDVEASRGAEEQKEKKKKKDFMQRRENKFKERSKVNPSIQKEKVERGQD